MRNAGGLAFDSRTGQIDTVSPTARHRATFFRSCVAKTPLSRGDESRHSLHASTYYRECNIVLILIWLLTMFKTTRNGKRLFFVFMVFRFVAVHVVNRELLSINEIAPIRVAAVPASTTLQHNTNNYEEFCFVNTFVYLMVT